MQGRFVFTFVCESLTRYYSPRSEGKKRPMPFPLFWVSSYPGSFVSLFLYLESTKMSVVCCRGAAAEELLQGWNLCEMIDGSSAGKSHPLLPDLEVSMGPQP